MTKAQIHDMFAQLVQAVADDPTFPVCHNLEEQLARFVHGFSPHVDRSLNALPDLAHEISAIVLPNYQSECLELEALLRRQRDTWRLAAYSIPSLSLVWCIADRKMLKAGHDAAYAACAAYAIKNTAVESAAHHDVTACRWLLRTMTFTIMTTSRHSTSDAASRTMTARVVA